MTGIDLTTGLPISDILTSLSNWFAIFAPYIELLAGVLLALFVIKYIINLFNTKGADDTENDIYP